MTRDFYDFRHQLEKALRCSQSPEESLALGVFNLDSGRVRRVQVAVRRTSFSGFVLGLELGIGHFDNLRLLGFPSDSKPSPRDSS